MAQLNRSTRRAGGGRAKERRAATVPRVAPETECIDMVVDDDQRVLVGEGFSLAGCPPAENVTYAGGRSR